MMTRGRVLSVARDEGVEALTAEQVDLLRMMRSERAQQYVEAWDAQQ